MTPTMPRKPRPQSSNEPADQPADRHKYPIMSVRAPDELANVLRQVADEERRSISQMITILVEEALVVRGRWSSKKKTATPQQEEK